MGALQVQQGLIGSDEGPGLEGLLVGGGRPGTPEVMVGQDDAEEGENGKKMHGDFLRVDIRKKRTKCKNQTDLLQVARLKSPSRHKKGNAPVGQSELATLAPNACIRETVRFKAWVEKWY